MGLRYTTTQWTDRLWARHCAQSRHAAQLIRQGRGRMREYPGFAEDLHALLYLRHPPPLSGRDVPWASRLLDLAQELPEWRTLRARCQANGFAAGIATEAVLEALKDELTDPDPEAAPVPLPAGGGTVGLTGAPTDPAGLSALRRAIRQAVQAGSQREVCEEYREAGAMRHRTL